MSNTSRSGSSFPPEFHISYDILGTVTTNLFLCTVMTVSSTVPGMLYFHIFLGILSKNFSKNGSRFLHIPNQFFSTVWTVDTTELH